MSVRQIDKLYNEVSKSKIFSCSQEKLNTLMINHDLDELTKIKNIEKIVKIQDALDKANNSNTNVKSHLDVLNLLYARILSSSAPKKTKYTKDVLYALTNNPQRFSEGMQELLNYDRMSEQRYIDLTSKIAEKLDSLDRDVVNSYLQNAIATKSLNLQSKIGNKTLEKTLSINPKVSLVTKKLANKALKFSFTDNNFFQKRKLAEASSFKIINILLGLGALTSFIGIMAGIVSANMFLIIGSVFLFVSFWGSGVANNSLLKSQVKKISDSEGRLFYNGKINKNHKNKLSRKSKKAESLKELIRTNRIQFEKNISKYEKSLLNEPRKSRN